MGLMDRTTIAGRDKYQLTGSLKSFVRGLSETLATASVLFRAGRACAAGGELPEETLQSSAALPVSTNCAGEAEALEQRLDLRLPPSVPEVEGMTAPTMQPRSLKRKRNAYCESCWVGLPSEQPTPEEAASRLKQ